MRKAILLVSLLIAMSFALSGCFLGHFRGQGNAFDGDESVTGSEPAEEARNGEASALR